MVIKILNFSENKNQAHRGYLAEFIRFGINPCFSVEAKAKICSFAPSKLPVTKYSPLSAMNVSRPQHLVHPKLKVGKPAVMDAVGLAGCREADCVIPCIWTVHRARHWINSCPFETNSEHCSIAAPRAALYASVTTIAKYFGRRYGGALILIRSNLSRNHRAGKARLGKIFSWLRLTH